MNAEDTAAPPAAQPTPTLKPKRPIKDSTLLTVWDYCTAQFDSQYGPVTYQTWCELEARRITAAGKKCELRVEGNQCCVALAFVAARSLEIPRLTLPASSLQQ